MTSHITQISRLVYEFFIAHLSELRKINYCSPPPTHIRIYCNCLGVRRAQDRLRKDVARLPRIRAAQMATYPPPHRILGGVTGRLESWAGEFFGQQLRDRAKHKYANRGQVTYVYKVGCWQFPLPPPIRVYCTSRWEGVYTSCGFWLDR